MKRLENNPENQPKFRSGPDRSKATSLRHGMREFGIVHGATREVRINRLEDRLTPRVPFPHRHDFYHLVVVISGSGWHEIDLQRYTLRPQQIFLMKPGQVHSWQMDRKTRAFVLEFGPEAVEGRAMGAFPDTFALRTSDQKATAGLLELMLAEYEGQTRDFEMALRHGLMLLLVLLSRHQSGPASKKSTIENLNPTIELFLSLVEAHFREHREVGFYAARLRLTPKALTMRVSRTLRRSARAVIQERCVLESKRWLVYSNFSVAEVAQELGFEDANYFSRFFRAGTGMSPGNFRLKALK